MAANLSPGKIILHFGRTHLRDSGLILTVRKLISSASSKSLSIFFLLERGHMEIGWHPKDGCSHSGTVFCFQWSWVSLTCESGTFEDWKPAI